MDSLWSIAIDEWCLAQSRSGRPRTTIATRRQHMEHLARRLGGEPGEISGDMLVAWMEKQPWATETRRGRRASYLAFWRWACVEGIADENPAESVPRVRPEPPRPRPTPDIIWQTALMRSTPRVRLMLRLAAHGLRRAEIARGHSSDILEDLDGHSLRVHGKGGRTRFIPLEPGLAVVLRSLPPGHFFPGSDDGHLSPRWVGKLLADVLPGDWTAHSLRHRFASRAYAVERDLAAVQDLLGHASPTTTRIYVHVPREHLRRTVLAATA